MLHKLLGGLDLLTALVFILSIITPFIPSKLILVLGIYLLVKGFLFALILDFGSILDILGAGIILASLNWTINLILAVIVTLYLGWKGILSFL